MIIKTVYCVCLRGTYFRMTMISGLLRGSLIPLTVTITTRTDQSKKTSFSRSCRAGEDIYLKTRQN